MWNPIIVLVTCLLYTVHSQNTDECLCVPYFQCRPNGTIITDGDGLIDERLGASCQNCNCSGLQVCCSHPKDGADVTPRKPENLTSCGYINPGGIGRISAEGSEALFGEFPWMVQIFEDGKYRCGGSLIHPSVVLTAAHCVRYSNNRTYTVRAGEYDTSGTNEILPYQDRDVSTIKSHEGFRERIYYNDIALVFLSQPFELRPHVNLACLVPASGIPTNTRCYSTGWGKPKFDRGQNYSTILKKIDLPLIGNSDCQKALRNTRLGKHYNLHESFICAGGEKNKDTCTGDGGGPLICPIEGQEDRYQQVGIVAWGIECNAEGVPGVYADVAVLRKWVDKEVAARNFETNLYQYT